MSISSLAHQQNVFNVEFRKIDYFPYLYVTFDNGFQFRTFEMILYTSIEKTLAGVPNRNFCQTKSFGSYQRTLYEILKSE